MRFLKSELFLEERCVFKKKWGLEKKLKDKCYVLCTTKKVSSLERDSFGPETRDETQNGPESRDETRVPAQPYYLALAVVIA